MATGGTVAAAMELIHKLGGEVVGLAFLIELAYLAEEKDWETTTSLPLSNMMSKN